MFEIKVPFESLKYILLQRGELQKIGNKINSSKFRDKFYYYYEKSSILKQLYNLYSSSQIETFFRKSRISSDYSKLMQQEFAMLKPYLPKKAKNILSIGCGVGGLDVILLKYYSSIGLEPNIYLVDKTKVSNTIYYEYHEKPAFYNSLKVASKLLEINGLNSSCIHTIDAEDFHTVRNISFDFVHSLRAWGFHFPVKTYIDKVYELMNHESSLILDLRTETDGLDLINNYFSQNFLIHEHKIFSRILVKK